MAGVLVQLPPSAPACAQRRRVRAHAAASDAAPPCLASRRLALTAITLLYPLRAAAEDEVEPLSAAADAANTPPASALTPPASDEAPPGYARYLGRATSSSSYGGYGGTDDFYKYSFLVPSAWKEATVSKTMKAVNGTDVLFVNPARTSQKAYAVSFAGQSYAKLKEDRRGIVSDLALSDSSIQDALTFADDVVVGERVIDGKTYADFDIVTGGEAIYLSVTCDGSRLYGLFVLGGSSAADDPARLIRASLRSLLTERSARTGAGI